MVEKARKVRIGRQPFELRASQVELAMQRVLPEPLRDHYVVVAQRRYPPKQVLGEVTGLDRSQFTTHHARRILAGLGFPAGRRARLRPPAPAAPHGQRAGRPRPSAETLEPFAGQWVATSEAEVLVSSGDPHAVVAWLSEHRQTADSMFQVPRTDAAASGVAPA